MSWETIAFCIAMYCGSLYMAWYVTVPVLMLFFVMARLFLKRFVNIRRLNLLALGLTAIFSIPLAWISAIVLYQLGKTDLP